MNMIEDPANARSMRTRSALLAATRAILEEQGFDALTMAAVAERAGVTRRAVYLHFASRTELVTDLFDYVVETEGLEASLRPVWEAPDAVSALNEWALHIARFHPSVLSISKSVRRMCDTDPDAALHWERVARDQLAVCRRLARRLDDEGRLAAPWTVDSATDMLWSLIADDFIERLLIDRQWSAEQFVEHLSSMLRSTLVSPSPAKF